MMGIIQILLAILPLGCFCPSVSTANAEAVLAAAGMGFHCEIEQDETTIGYNTGDENSDSSQRFVAQEVAEPALLIPEPLRVIVGQGIFTLEDNAGFVINVSLPSDRKVALGTSVTPVTPVTSGISRTSVLSAESFNEDAGRFKQYLMKLPFHFKEVSSSADAVLVFDLDFRHPKKSGVDSEEAYSMKISGKRITVKAQSVKGCFYAVQSLLLMTRMGQIRHIRCCTIEDFPRFSYRGLHFDVSRHFRSKAFLKKQMDAMALFKLNKMHLHLTDGAGWRLQIDAYPRLTDYAAWRPYKKWYDWWTADRSYCESDFSGTYGGYYTKDDIRDILEYAKERHIDVIPEIEMPGHSEEVIAAYPALGCTCAEGKSSDFCPGKEETFEFLENVLAEVIDLFPSEYIHIGGDEASKEHWKECSDCQARMESEGLEDVDQLQSYLIHRIEKFVNSKGRKIIGWDEILQGGLAPNATVMSWRGEEGGLEAARSGHNVIMTPSGFCYFDYSQDAPFKEPVSIGGYLPLSKTYSYEPLNLSLTREQQENIIGVQGNLWSEYVVEDNHAEYMYYPRALAIAEIGWTAAGRKDYDDFRVRALGCLDILSYLGYETFDLGNEYGQRKESLESVSHLGIGKAVTYNIPYSSQYPSSGNNALVDGVIGGWTYGDQRWQGFLGDFDVTIDLGEIRPVRYLGATFMNLESAWVHVPASVEFQVSEDGENFRTEGVMYGDVSLRSSELVFKNFYHICDISTRYIRVVAKRCSRPGSWIFVDEVVVN